WSRPPPGCYRHSLDHEHATRALTCEREELTELVAAPGGSQVSFGEHDQQGRGAAHSVENLRDFLVAPELDIAPHGEHLGPAELPREKRLQTFDQHGYPARRGALQRRIVHPRIADEDVVLPTRCVRHRHNSTLTT